MKQAVYSWKRILVLAAGVLVLGGCIGPTPYQKGDLFGGYGDSPGAQLGSYEVHFLAQKRTFAFAKSCVYYRAAEVTYENNYRYFSVTKTEDWSTGAYSPNGGGAMASVSEVPQISIHIQCYAQRPPVACYDAYQYLNSVKRPGTEVFYTVEQRRADKAAGNAK